MDQKKKAFARVIRDRIVTATARSVEMKIKTAAKIAWLKAYLKAKIKAIKLFLRAIGKKPDMPFF